MNTTTKTLLDSASLGDNPSCWGNWVNRQGGGGLALGAGDGSEYDEIELAYRLELGRSSFDLYAREGQVDEIQRHLLALAGLHDWRLVGPLSIDPRGRVEEDFAVDGPIAMRVGWEMRAPSGAKGGRPRTVFAVALKHGGTDEAECYVRVDGEKGASVRPERTAIFELLLAVVRTLPDEVPSESRPTMRDARAAIAANAAADDAEVAELAENLFV